MSRWFRFYDEAINDPKILRLSDANFRAWVTLLCLASKNDGVLPSTNDIALVLRMKPTKVAEWLAHLTAARLIDNDNGLFSPHNWNARQFKSDTSNERVKRHRDKKRNAECNVTPTVTVTPPDTEQIQITEQISSLRSDSARKRGARLPEDWMPSADDLNEAQRKLGPAGTQAELDKFHDYWKAQPGQRGVKLDWDATFRNWIRNAKGQSHEQTARQYRTNPASGPAPTGDDAVVTGMARALQRRREARAAADGGGFSRSGDAASEPDPDRRAASGDAGAHRQLAFLPAGNASRE